MKNISYIMGKKEELAVASFYLAVILSVMVVFDILGNAYAGEKTDAYTYQDSDQYYGSNPSAYYYDSGQDDNYKNGKYASNDDRSSGTTDAGSNGLMYQNIYDY